MRRFKFGKIRLNVDAKRLIQLDFYTAVAEIFRPGQQYAAATFVRPTTPNGFSYEVTTAGQAGSSEPVWPTTIDATVSVGSGVGALVFTCRAPGANGVQALTSPVIADVPTGELTIGSASVVNGKGTNSMVEFLLSTPIAGRTYRVECVATAGTQTVVGSIDVEGRID